MSVKPISAEAFDQRFDDGEDMADHVDWSNARRSNQPVEHVKVDLPAWMVTRLDDEARRRGVTREALIETWMQERLDAAA